MPETEEEKQKRWAKNRVKSYMTPAMAHAMAMSKYQSQNKYKEQFNKSRGKGYTAVTSTPELEHVKQQSIRISQNKYKSAFEKSKAKFTAVADDPETLRVKRVTNQVSKVAYSGKGSAIAESKYKRNRPTTSVKEDPAKPDPTETADEVPTSHGRPLEVEETIEEESNSMTRENGEDFHQEEEPESFSHGQQKEEHPGYSEEASGGDEEEEPSQENGDDYSGQYDQAQDAGEEEQNEGGYEGREYKEADAEEGELKEFTDGGLDDFYDNLG